jgi:hypothetical protein
MRVLLLVSVLALGACARQSEVTLPTAWARTDGQPVNSTLLEIDSLDCRDEMQKPDDGARAKADKADDSRVKVDEYVGCMREHGYVQAKS